MKEDHTHGASEVICHDFVWGHWSRVLEHQWRIW